MDPSSARANMNTHPKQKSVVQSENRAVAFFRQNSAVVVACLVLVLCITLSLAFHWPFLKDPYWLVLDDASRIVNFFDELLASPTLETLMSLDPTRSRPLYWALGAALYKLGNGEPEIFWHFNWVALAGGLYLSYVIARLFAKSCWSAAIAPVLLFFMPPVVPNYAETSNQEPLLILFGGLFVYLLLKADRRLESETAWRRWIPTAILCWLSGALFVFSKEPATAGVAFPVGWMMLGLPLSAKGTIRRRSLFLGATFFWMAVLAYVTITRIGGVVDAGAGGEYLSQYSLDWKAIGNAHGIFMTALLPRIWPVLAIPAIALALSLATLRKDNWEIRLAYLRPFLFFSGMALIQYCVILPWIPMTKNLLPSCLPLAIVNAICIDCLLTLGKRQ